MWNRSGFSLAQVMVAMGVMGMLTYTIIETIQYGMKGARGAQEKFERQSNILLIQSLLKDTEACRLSFEGAEIINNTTVYNVSPIKDRYGYDRLTLNVPIGSAGGQVTPTSIQLKNWNDGTVGSYAYDHDSNPMTPPEMREFSSAELHITYTKTLVGQSFGGETYTEQLPLVLIRKQADNTVVTCATDEQNYVDAICQSLGGTIENNFCRNLKIEQLAAGGATNPALTVRGFTRINSSLGIGVDPTGTTGNLDMSGNLLAQGDSLFGSGAGNTHRFTGGVAIGLGAAPTNEGLGVGVNPPGLGSLAILNNTFLGNNASDEHFVQGSLGIGVAPGNLGGLGVGTAAPGAGNIRASGDLTIAENATISNSGLNNTVNIATGGGTDTVNINSVSGTTNLAGTVKLNNPLVFNTNTFNMLTSIVAADQNRVATIKNISDAIYGYLATGIDDANKNAIIQKLLEFADKPDTGVNSLRNFILQSFAPMNYLPIAGTACSPGSYIKRIYYAGGGNITAECEAPAVTSCNAQTPGSCSKICAGAYCATAYTAGVSGLYMNDCAWLESSLTAVPRYLYKSCPAGQVMTGLEVGRVDANPGSIYASSIRINCCNAWASAIRN